MKQEEEFLENLKSKRREKNAIFAIIIFALILLTVIAAIINKIRLQYQLDQKLDEIRAEGYPTNFEELAIWYENGNKFPAPGEEPRTIPDSENAAVTLNEAYKLMVRDVPNPDYNEPLKLPGEDGYFEWYSRRKHNEFLDDSNIIGIGFYNEKRYLTIPFPQKVLKDSEIYLKANNKAVEKIQESIYKPHCIFPSNEVINQKMSFPYQYKFRQSYNLLYLKAILSAEKGDLDQAVTCLIDLGNYPNLMNNQPFYMTQINNLHFHLYFFNKLRLFLNKYKLSKCQLKLLKKKISIPEFNSIIKNTLISHYPTIKSNTFINDVTLYYLDNKGIKGKTMAQYLDPIISLLSIEEKSSLIYLDYVGKNINIVNKKYLENKKGYEEAENYFEGKKQYWWMHYYLLSPTIMKIRALEIKAAFLTAQTTLAIEEYNLNYNKLPDSLDQLVPEFLDFIPIDPFDNKPLRYSKGVLQIGMQAKTMTKEEIKQYPPEMIIKDWRWKGFNSMYEYSKSPKYNTPFNGYKVEQTKKDGYMVYSVGRNQKDDGGDEQKDITFFVVREGLKLE